MFMSVIGVAFMLFIAEFLIGQMLQSPQLYWVYLCFHLGIFVVFNAVPEVIHQQPV